jgi:hypothetical protein
MVHSMHPTSPLQHKGRAGMLHPCVWRAACVALASSVRPMKRGRGFQSAAGGPADSAFRQYRRKTWRALLRVTTGPRRCAAGRRAAGRAAARARGAQEGSCFASCATSQTPAATSLGFCRLDFCHALASTSDQEKVGVRFSRNCIFKICGDAPPPPPPVLKRRGVPPGHMTRIYNTIAPANTSI